VIAMLMQRCRGEGPYWHSLPWAVPYSDVFSFWPPEPTNRQFFFTTLAVSHSLEPPDPPPRISFSVGDLA
jgi:hypothetical protein